MSKSSEYCTAPNLVNCKPMAAKKKWAEDMQARFPKGTFARIAAVLDRYEDRTEFVREAVEREQKRREELKKKPTRK